MHNNNMNKHTKFKTQLPTPLFLVFHPTFWKNSGSELGYVSNSYKNSKYVDHFYIFERAVSNVCPSRSTLNQGGSPSPLRWRLHMIEKLSSGTINIQTINQCSSNTLVIYASILWMMLFRCLLFTIILISS